MYSFYYLHCSYIADYLGQVFQWSMENIQSQLPLQPNGIMCFTLCINGVSDFLSDNVDLETADQVNTKHRMCVIFTSQGFTINSSPLQALGL